MASNIVKDDAKDIELLTNDFKISEYASITTISAQESCVTTALGHDACAPTVPGDDACAPTVPGSEVGTVLAQRKSDSLPHLKKIAESIESANLVYATQLSESLAADLKSIKEKEIYDQVEKNVELNECLEREYKEYFGELAPVLQCIMSVGTSHLPLASQKGVFMNLLVVRTDMKSRCKWLNQVKSNFENIQAILSQIKFALGSPQFDRASSVAANLTSAISAIESIIEQLGNYERFACIIIDSLKKSIEEPEIKGDVPSPDF